MPTGCHGKMVKRHEMCFVFLQKQFRREFHGEIFLVWFCGFSFFASTDLKVKGRESLILYTFYKIFHELFGQLPQSSRIHR